MHPSPPPSPLHPREAEIRALEAMEAEIEKSGSGIPPLMIERSAENEQVLGWIGTFLCDDIDPALAMTDPARFRKFCRVRMEITLRGYRSSAPSTG